MVLKKLSKCSLISTFQLRYNPYISTYLAYMLYLLLINQGRDIVSQGKSSIYTSIGGRKKGERALENFQLQDFQEKCISKAIKDFETLQFIPSYDSSYPAHPIYCLFVSTPLHASFREDFYHPVEISHSTKVFFLLGKMK